MYCGYDVCFLLYCVYLVLFFFFFSYFCFCFVLCFFFFVFFFFFFFQAEDGIRDRTVTGVQTCALPISCFSIDTIFFLGGMIGGLIIVPRIKMVSIEKRVTIATIVFAVALAVLSFQRSEERRVGKELRSWWVMY